MPAAIVSFHQYRFEHFDSTVVWAVDLSAHPCAPLNLPAVFPNRIRIDRASTSLAAIFGV